MDEVVFLGFQIPLEVRRSISLVKIIDFSIIKRIFNLVVVSVEDLPHFKKTLSQEKEISQIHDLLEKEFQTLLKKLKYKSAIQNAEHSSQP